MEAFSGQKELENNTITKWLLPNRGGAEAAIDGSVEHFGKKLEFLSGPKVVKTFDS